MMSRLSKLLLLAAAFTIIALGCSAEQPNALVSLSVASLRAAPAHSAEMVTQAPMGTPVACVDSGRPDWLAATLPDGYVGWIPRAAVKLLDGPAMERWRGASPRVAVVGVDGVYVVADTLSRAVVSDVALSAILEGSVAAGSRWSAVRLPDGREGYIASSAIRDFDSWVSQPFDSIRAIAVARSMMGSPYLWGGTTNKGVDCSGLVKMVYLDQAMVVPRDASQQALAGREVPLSVDSLRCCDLLFYSPDTLSRRVTHVAIYDAGGLMIHASGCVRENSIDPESPAYFKRLLLGARRFVGAEMPGIRPVGRHPWYVGACGERTTLRSFILPAAMVGVGAWGVAGGLGIGEVNHWIGNAIGGHHATILSDVAQFIPMAAMVLPDGALGATPRYSWTDRALLSATAFVISEGATQVLKRVVRARRPDGSDRHSFPSGHAARAFMGAELLRDAFGGWVGWTAYGVATATAALRVVGSRHRFTDVVGGAGIGILAARVARLLLPAERRLLRLESRGSSVVLAVTL